MFIFMNIEGGWISPEEYEKYEEAYEKYEKYNIIPEFKNLVDCLKFKRDVMALGNMCFYSKVNEFIPNLKVQQENVNPKRKLMR